MGSIYRKGSTQYNMEKLAQIISAIVMLIVITICGVVYTYINNYQRTECIKNGGTAVDNEVGRFEKCMHN